MTEHKRIFRSTFGICLLLGVITLALYLPAVRHDFIQYDDQQYVTENPHVQSGLTGQNWIWAFGYHAGNWHPLAWLSHMLDCQLYGLNPAGHHLTNILLHVANTILLFLVLNRMTRAAWRSASVAALFGWHPLHVESVAWVAERKDVLCTFFWMLTIGAYARYAQESKVQSPKSKIWYAFVLLCFALALMSKPMAVTLPFVLLLLDLWPLKRFTTSEFRFSIWNLVWEKAPLFTMVATACLLTLSAQEQAIVSTAGLSIGQRLWHALVAYAHYMGAMFMPHGLAVYYPYKVVIPLGQIITAAALVAATTIVALWFIRQRSYIATGWFWFLGTLVPVIGLVQVGDQAWADRYTYIPLIGLFIIVVWGAADAVKRPLVLGGVAAATGLALLAGTTLQLRHWRNTKTLFTHTARVIPNNYMAITMLGNLLAREGKFDEAVEHYHTALRIQPGFPEAHFFLGNALDQQGKLDEAIAEYQQALWFKPITATTHILLGVALGKKQRPDEAAAHFLEAIKLNPESAVAHNNLARILHTKGRFDDAIEYYLAALKLDPRLAQAHNNLGILFLQKDRLVEGTARLREAARLNPDNPETEYNLALALNQQRQWREAAEFFNKTVSKNSTDPNAHYQFALALTHLDRTREAMSRFASALLIQPDYPDALDGLSWILATSPNQELRNGSEALRMAERACELTERKDAAKLKTLAAAHAETGHYPEAVATAQSALGVAAATGRKEMVPDLAAMLENFQATKPWRVPTP